MSRLPRLTVPDYPHHIIQRGHNRQAIFADAQDAQCLLDALRQQARQHRVALHAYVLMPNHLHLLATPASADGVPLLMQGLGRAYVRHFNRRHGRSGTLWEGRYRSAVIEPHTWLLPCMAYMDANPVRAGLAQEAAQYPWSSHAHYSGLRPDPTLTQHAQYWQLGDTPFAREIAYAQLVQTGPSPAQQQALTESALGSWALGSADFVAALQAHTPRRVSKGKAGRPRKSPPPQSPRLGGKPGFPLSTG